MAESFNWYEIIPSSDEVTQGDIFINLPIMVPKNYDKMIENTSFEECKVDEKFELDMRVEFGDYIVLTQPCDLAHPKAELKDIILCRIYDIADVGFGRGKIADCIEGRRPQFYILNENKDFTCKFKESGFNFHVVNFDEIEKVPINTLKNIGKLTENRLRLLPPYREHLSQAFAKFFMRIGLPSDIKKPDIFAYAKPDPKSESK